MTTAFLRETRPPSIRHQDIEVVTLEDPVEHEIAGVNQIQVDDKLGLGFDGARPRVLGDKTWDAAG